jgi:hypothetical protein
MLQEIRFFHFADEVVYVAYLLLYAFFVVALDHFGVLLFLKYVWLFLLGALLCLHLDYFAYLLVVVE